jgi:hypothetical protein
MLRKALLTVSLVMIAALPSVAAVEKRCGWLDNPTPANWWLTDADGRWIIGTQGGYQARGMDMIPEFKPSQYVKTNGYYGYTCACMDVTTNSNLSRIRRIYSVKPLKLSQCRQDPNLPDR